jgi:alkylation response protein AidB-like acyl-CoA dehydrogenase
MAEELEDFESFRTRARAFLSSSVPRRDPDAPRTSTKRARELQRTLFEGGFAGIAFPREYGGAGLTLDHQKVFAEEAAGYEMPSALMVSVAMMAPTLLDHGSEELKRRHLPAMLRGDEVWLQLLSEPSGGSDMAAAMTRAELDGDTWIVNGAKMWTTGANEADYGMCLARTDWDAPKHRGLSMLAVPLDAPGVTIEPTVSNEGGPAHFFQEFLDDVTIPARNLIGGLHDGWAVAHSLLFHERNATAGVGHGRGYASESSGRTTIGSQVDDLANWAKAAGRANDAATRQLIAEAHITAVVARQASDRVMTGMRTGAFKGDWGSLLKLGMGVDTPRRGEINIAVAASDGVVWPAEQGDNPEAPSVAWLGSRSIAMAGGTNEMQRNIVSERLLGMPREPASDRDVPFREVVSRRAPGARTGG